MMFLNGNSRVVRYFVSRGLLVVVIGMSPSVHAQVGADRIEGLRDNTPRWHAITGARIVVSPDKIIDRGVLVMRDGVVTAVGANVAVPAGARVWKLDGRTVYAGFIDLASNVGVPSSLRAVSPNVAPWVRGLQPPAQPEVRLASRALASNNRMVRSEIDIAQQLDLNADEVKAARELGFTSVLAAPASGVFRGQSALLNLAAVGASFSESVPSLANAKSFVLIPRAAQHLATELERSREANYPSSLMGAIALQRQTFYDARWYRGAHDFYRGKSAIGDYRGKSAGGERPQENASLDALGAALAGRQLVIHQADSEQDFLRIAKIRDEFSLRSAALGNGFEYRRAQQLKSLALPVIVPINFPPPPEIENPDSAIDVGLETLQHWEQAPSNLVNLQKSGVEFAITPMGLREPAKDFWTNIRLALRRGLSPAAAIAALTTVPAKLIGASGKIGTLEPGHLANLVIANGDLFDANEAGDRNPAEIEIAFVEGRPYPTPAYERVDVRGKWKVNLQSGTVEWDITGTKAKPALKIDGANCDIRVRGRQLVVTLPCGKNVGEVETIVADFVADQLRGTAQQVSGKLQVWNAQKVAPYVASTVEPVANPGAPAPIKDVMPPPLPVSYPAGPYSVAAPVRPVQILIRNATIWTSAGNNLPTDLPTKADMLVRDGRIAAIGANLVASADATVIDAAGKHVTAGIIDAHSHTAVAGGVNEFSSSITAEVRIGDTLDATDINIYRELAGGVTAANILHGSANAVGGQNQVIKMRWGADAEGLKFANAMPGIKFALGENVKQSNWENSGSRYPQTRMGVEQIYRDGFQAAKLYRDAWATWRTSKAGPEPRRDLQLDTLVEILEKKRVIHIHSYRADEILMFVKIAKEFGFTVATFQHVLEGYKVADAMASIGAGGSTFSDWWGYKMEVIDAIPTNGVLMHKAGVLTTFNSDSDELARRLNTEAAKAVKYGGLSENEALKFVTINAAKQLRIDNRVGSLEVGKDADFVIWSDNPLSTKARAEQTWIDGARYFDLKADADLRESAKLERARIVAKAMPARLARLNAPAGGAPNAGARPMSTETPPPSVSETMEYMALQRWLHDQGQIHDGYWSGGAWHECTEDAR
jgi:imidazolonepropionase-like amidohydrolase